MSDDLLDKYGELMLLNAVTDLTRQIILLREDLRPELKKAEIFRKKNALAQEIKADSQNYIPKRKR